MKQSFVLMLIALAAACSCTKQPEAKTSEPEAKSEPESRVARSTNGESVVKLEASVQKVMGLQTATLKAVDKLPQVKAYGRVVDASSLVSSVAELAIARASAEASKAELKRLKTLAEQSNTSERALEAAEAAARRDTAMLESARLKLLGNWGPAVSENQNLQELAISLSSLSSCIAHLTVPVGEVMQGVPTQVRVFASASESQAAMARLLGPAPMADVQVQGSSYLVLIETNTFHLAPGAAVTALLTMPGKAKTGVAIPQSAVVSYLGANWVYVQTAQNAFQRVNLKLLSPLEDSWFARNSLKPGDEVVVVGAQQLLSEELKGAGEQE